MSSRSLKRPLAAAHFLQRFLLLHLCCLTSALRTQSGAGVQQEPPPPKGRLAVLITGLQNRLLWHSKTARIIEPAASAGHTVDVYMDIISSSAEGRYFKYSRVAGQLNQTPESNVPDLAAVLSSGISAAGGRLAYFKARTAKEDLALPWGRAAKRLPHRLDKYPPLSDPIGKNLLRRYQTVENLMRRISASGRQYDLVLWTRDDDQWLGNLHLSEFLSDPLSSRRLYSKDCLTWDGINDKTLLLGREAAEVMLGRLYSDFWLRDSHLEEAKNAETFLRAFALVKGVEPVAVPFGRLPTADSIYVTPAAGGPPQLCQKDLYLCSGLPTAPSFDQPVPCAKLVDVSSVAGANPPDGDPKAAAETEAVDTPDTPSSMPTVLAVVNYWAYPDPQKRSSRSAALVRTLQALGSYAFPVYTMLVTNEWTTEAVGLVAEQIVRPVQFCTPTMSDPLCMAWEAMRVLRNASSVTQGGCDLWRNCACGELKYDYYMYLEGDILMSPSSFFFWAMHVDVLFKKGYVLVPHREEPYQGHTKLTECVRNHIVDHLAKTRVLRDTTANEKLYEDPQDRIYLQPPVPYSGCLLMSKWQFEVFRAGKAWDYETAARTMKGGKVREAAIKGLLGDERLTALRAVTHLKIPVLHQEMMTGAEGLYPSMCNVEDYRAKAQTCATDAAGCPSL